MTMEAARAGDFLSDMPLLAVEGLSSAASLHLIDELEVRFSRQGLTCVVVVDRSCGSSGACLYRSLANRLQRADTPTAWSLQNVPLQGTAGPLAATLHGLVRTYDLVLLLGECALDVTLLQADETTRDDGQPVAIFAESSDAVGNMAVFIEDWLRHQWLKTPVWGCLLIGGQSSRMGQPKHLLPHADGSSWLEHNVHLLQNHTENVVLAGGGVVPESLEHLLRVPDIPDIAGPLTGILSVMRWYPKVSWLVVACDLPRIEHEALDWLLAQRRPGCWGTVPRQQKSGYLEPLLAHYDFRSRGLLEEAYLTRCLRIGKIAHHRRIATPSIPERLEGCWLNVNTPDDLAALS